jgi:hypothetical protein
MGEIAHRLGDPGRVPRADGGDDLSAGVEAVMSDWLGWAATAVFVSSYFFRHVATVRLVQMLGALTWVAYGLATRAAPVVVANLLVLGAAAADLLVYRQRRNELASE